jgi:hypothetical protein
MGNKLSPNTLKNTFVFKEQPISAIEGLTVQFESKVAVIFILSRECIACQSGTIS